MIHFDTDGTKPGVFCYNDHLYKWGTKEEACQPVNTMQFEEDEGGSTMLQRV